MPSYVLPQVLIFQEFESSPIATAQPLLACIVGEQFSLHRYSEVGEKETIKVTDSYDFTSETCYTWPNRPVGSVVDTDYVKVFMDDALLKYYHNDSGDASTVGWISPGKNRVRAPSVVWKDGNGHSRDAELLRDVKVGDVVKLLASGCGEATSFQSSVVGLEADTVAADIAAATSDEDNKSTQSASNAHEQTAGHVNDIGISSVSAGSYNGLADGDINEVYTIEVIAGSSDNDATTAVLKVTSASGHDNDATVVPSAFGAATTIGSRGLTVTFNDSFSSSDSDDPGQPAIDFIAGQKWTVTVHQIFTKPAPTSGGDYTGSEDTTYVVTVSRGGKYADSAKPQITVTTTTGVDISGPTTVSATATDVAVGTLGATIRFSATSLCKGDRYYVNVTAEADGAIRTLVLANNLPAALRGACAEVDEESSTVSAPDLDISLYIKKNIEVTENRLNYAPTVNWTTSDTEICINSGVIAYDSSWQDGGELQPLGVEDGIIYVEHRDRVADNCTTIGTVSDVSEVEDALGTIHPDNPLAFGVYKAVLNSNGQDVKYLGICGNPPTLTEWLGALELLVGRDDVYGLVPLTQDKDILDAFLANAKAESTPESGRWRVTWLNMAAIENKPIYTTSDAEGEDPVLATIHDDPDTTGTQYTIVEADGEKFLTNGVTAGDIVRYGYVSDGFGNFTYSEAVIDSVENEETLRLASGPDAAVNVASKIEIYRHLNKTQLAADLAQNPGLFASRRARLVWPDEVGNAGLTFPGYFLCAALAGLRSGVLPHQGLTNVEIVGFDDLTRTTEFFSATQLNTLASSGYWVVSRDHNDGTVFTRHQLTSDNTEDINVREDSVTSNLDEMSYELLSALKQYTGRGNVTQTMINILRGVITGKLTQFSNTITVDRLGPQINSYKIRELAPDTVLKDRIVCRVKLELAYPLNNLELHLIG